MNHGTPTSAWRSRRGLGFGGAILCMLLGAGSLLVEPVWSALGRLSFDLPFLVQPKPAPDEAVVVSMDTPSRRSLHGEQAGDSWSRTVHADFVDRAFRLGAEAVVFDIAFIEPRPVQDEAFAAALERHRPRVVLGVELVQGLEGGTGMAELLPTTPTLGTNLLEGVINLPLDPDGALRRPMIHENSQYVSLAQRAAQLVMEGEAPVSGNHWIRYYGPRRTLNNIRYDRFLEQPSGETNLFRGKVLFVGWDPDRPEGSGREEFRTPYTRWTRQTETGVSVHATIFLNHLHDDFLSRMAPVAEYLLVIAAGGVIGFGLAWLRPVWSLWLGLAGMILVTALVVWLTWDRAIWFSWGTIVLVQVPAGVVWSFAAHTWVLAGDKKRLETILSESQRARSVRETSATSRRVPDIPDHELLKCVGRGAYGEVWLARDVLGTYHAVKIVYRNTFADPAPFEREFRGIKKFTPISRQHAGWVDVLHAGRNDPPGYFFYIMEAADDVVRGTDIEPESYEPHNLSGDLSGGALSVRQALTLGVALADALHHLHEQGLIHRDIKPSNVIYVRGQPKFADIGLVTDIASRSEVSRIGTEGYMAPEGPGTPASDVYSLGKLLYEAALGRDPRAFPEMPTRLFELADEDPAHRLYQVVAKACAAEPEERFASAKEFKAALEVLRMA